MATVRIRKYMGQFWGGAAKRGSRPIKRSNQTGGGANDEMGPESGDDGLTRGWPLTNDYQAMITLVITLICVGFLLLALEVVLPGGIAGFCGATALLISLVVIFASREFDPLGIGGKLLVAGGIVLVVGIGFVWWMKNFQRMPFIRSELLEAEIAGSSVSNADELEELVGQSGTALTDLRPSGKIRIDGDRYAAVARVGFISRGASILVIDVRAGELVVRAANPSSTSDEPDDLVPA